MTHISQRLTRYEKLHLLLRLLVEEEEEEGGGGVEAETILPPSEPPRSSPVRSRNTSKAPPSESRCQGNVTHTYHVFQ